MNKKTNFYKWVSKSPISRIPQNVDIWLDKVETSKKTLRDVINTDVLCKQVTITKKDIKSPESDRDIDAWLKNIRHFMRNSQSVNEINKISSKDILNRGIGNNIKPTKLILRCAEKDLKNNSLNYYTYCDIKNYTNAISNKLSKINPKLKTNSLKSYIYLDTRPESFLNISKYECDKNTCFADTGSNSSHRFNIGADHNTFVLTISEKKEVVSFNKSRKCLMRAWGYYDEYHKNWIVTNFYYKGLAPAICHTIIKTFFSRIVGTELKFDSIDNTIYDECEEDYVYCNGDAMVFYENYCMDSWEPPMVDNTPIIAKGCSTEYRNYVSNKR